MNLLRANFEDLRGFYYEETEARTAANEILQAIRNEENNWLGEILRHHKERAVRKSTEIQLRASLDQLLNFYGVLEIGILSGFIELPNENVLWRETRILLENKYVRKYYVEHYPLKLPQLLLLRIEGKLGFVMREVKSAPHVVEFLSLDRRFINNHQAGSLLWMLDDFTINQLRFLDVVETLKEPKQFIKSLLLPPDKREFMDKVLHEFSLFMQFCFDLDDHLEATQTFPALQSEIWNHYSYWFGIIGANLEERLGVALGQFLKWKPAGNADEQLTEIQNYVAKARIVLKKLVSPQFRLPVDKLLRNTC